MPATAQEFWKLAVNAKLFEPREAKNLWEEFRAGQEAASHNDASALARWLTSRRLLSEYQASALLKGREGPFLVDDYEITARITTGRLGGLYEASRRGTNEFVTLWLHKSAESEAERDFAKVNAAAGPYLLASAAHPHLVRCEKVLRSDDVIAVVLERLRGETLREHHNRLNWRPNIGDIARYAQHAALGLAALHEHGVAHGDIRFSNLWLDETGAVKLLHFPLVCGLDNVVRNALRKIKRGDSCPQANYLAPELIHNPSPTPAADLYALGCLLYQLLALRPPFDEPDIARKIEAHASTPPPPLSDFASDIPEPLQDLVHRLLAKNPEDRPAQAVDVAAALAPFASTPDPSRQPASLSTPVGEGEALNANSIDDAIFDRPFVPESRPAKRNPYGWIAAAVAGVVLVVGLALALRSKDSAPQEQAAATPEQSTSAVDAAGAVAAAAPAAQSSTPSQPTTPAKTPDGADPFTIGYDAPLWASPTSGKPLDLKYLASGPEIIIAFRPAAIAQHPESEKLLDARVSGAISQWWNGELRALAGMAPAQIDQAILAVIDRGESPRISAVFRPTSPVDEQELLAAWQNPQAIEFASQRFFERDGQAWLVTDDAEGQVIVVAPADEMRQMIEEEFLRPALMIEFENLLKASDRDRMLTVLFKPRYTIDQKSLWGEEVQQLRDALDQFLLFSLKDGRLEPPKAALVSGHLDSRLFLEMRIAADGFIGTPVVEVAQEYRTRLRNIGAEVQRYLGGQELSSYARQVLFAFPSMLRELDAQTRLGAWREQVILQAYLPDIAAHNLALGARLALTETSMLEPSAAPAPVAAQADAPADPLDKRMSLVFDKNTFEQALEIVADEIGVEIEVIGADLQAIGVTRNQSMGIEARDQTAREILKTLLLKASPQGALIYTRKSGEGGGSVIQITTREAAKARGDAIPPEWAN